MHVKSVARLPAPIFILLFALTAQTGATAIGRAESAHVSERPAPRDNVVLQWNSALLQAIRNTGLAPMHAARALAIVHTCMFDAWAAYDRTAVGTRLGASLRRPSAEHRTASKNKAISFAAYRALVDLLSPQRSVLFDPQMASLGYDPSDLSSDLTTPEGIGNEACAAVLSFRHTDGANQLGDVNGGAPYSDYTGYAPVNSAGEIVDPSHWQPLQNANGTSQLFAAAHWGLVTPFALVSPDQFRPSKPALYGTDEYTRQAAEVVELSRRLNDRRKAIALYWADGPKTETPPGHWSLFAQWVSRRDRHTLDEDVKMFFVLGNALLDASIAVWDCKRQFDYVRPITAIRYLYAGQTIDAWKGPQLGTQAIAGETFLPYIPTPPFPEYTSGHSAFSASAAEVLRLFTGSDKFGASHTILAGSSIIEPGFAPAGDVELYWDTFDDAADEAGISRRYGGIHFKDGDLASRRMGRQIGGLAWAKAQTYFAGATRSHGR
jgi:hypothetical protein